MLRDDIVRIEDRKMATQLFFRVLLALWPLWLWLIAMHIVGQWAGTTPFHDAAVVGASGVLAFAATLLSPFPEQRRLTIVGAAALAGVLGLWGFERVYDHWQAVWVVQGFSLGDVLNDVDMSLVVASVFAVAAAIEVPLLDRQKILEGWRGFEGGVREGQSDAHGSARWMTWAEAKAVFSGSEVIVGETYDPRATPAQAGRADLLRFDISRKGHLVTVGGAGSGKTVSVTIPNIMNWPRSLVVHDPKGELATTWGTRRANKMGRTIIDLGPDRDDSDATNVLDWLDPSTDQVIQDACDIAGWLAGEDDHGRDDGNANNAAFRANALNVLWVGLLDIVFNTNIPTEAKTLETLRDRFITSQNLEDILKKISEMPRSWGYGKVQKLAAEQLRTMKAQETWAGVMFNVSSMTAWLSVPSLARLVSGRPRGKGRSVPTSALVDGDTDFFISIPLQTLDSTPAISRVLVGSFLAEMLRYGRRNPDAPKPTLFLLDEMPRLGRMKYLETARDAGRPNIVLWTIIQDLGQLTRHYGREGLQSWMGECALSSFFGINDPDSADYVSRKLGVSTIEVISRSTNEGGSSSGDDPVGGRNWGGGRNTSFVQRPLMTPDEVQRLRTSTDGSADEQLIFIRGEPPLRCGIAKWFRRPEFNKNL